MYDELRRVARARLRAESPGSFLQTTALVHEAYLKLVDINHMTVRNRAHLLALAARLMRQVLVDHARRKNALKRGGEDTMITLDDVPLPAATPTHRRAKPMDEALHELATLDPTSRVVELKFFAGLSIGEAAGRSASRRRPWERDWTIARAWLHRRLS